MSTASEKLNIVKGLNAQQVLNTTRVAGASQRSDTEAIFSDTPIVDRIKLKLASAPLIPAEQIESEKEIANLVAFFLNHPCIDIRSYQKAAKSFRVIFSKADPGSKLGILSKLLESSSSKSRFGKVSLELENSQAGRLKFSISRSSKRFGSLKQYFSYELASSGLTVYTVREGFAELLRAHNPKSGASKKRSRSTIEFDAKSWLSFNVTGIDPANYAKSLDCLERNSLTLRSFVTALNARDFSNVLLPQHVKKAKIKTNAKDTSYIDAELSCGQKVSAKFTNFASMLRVSR